MRKMYLSAPLPFVGQKRMLAKEFMKVLEQYPDGTLFVDLFGGSGLLSHITKSLKPHSTVIYNDFDNYRFRMKHIPQTNQLLADIREMVGNSVPRHKIIKGELRERIFSRIEQEENSTGYVDFITLSSSILFFHEIQTVCSGYAEGSFIQQYTQDRLPGMYGLSRRAGNRILRLQGSIQPV